MFTETEIRKALDAARLTTREERIEALLKMRTEVCKQILAEPTSAPTAMPWRHGGASIPLR
jgi:hypothetical protein